MTKRFLARPWARILTLAVLTTVASSTVGGCSLFGAHHSATPDESHDTSSSHSILDYLPFFTSHDVLANKAAAQLKTLQANPQAVQVAPGELAAAAQAVDAALHPNGGVWNAKHLAYVAEKRVQIAQTTVDIATQQATYKKLVAHRDALKKAQASAPSETPVTHPFVPVPAPAPVTKIPPQTAAPSTPPTPQTPQQTAAIAPAASASPPATGMPAPYAGTRGALLTLPPSRFDAHDQLTSTGRDALYGLLKALARYPQANVLVRGSVPARVKAVADQLTRFGVPAARVKQQHNTDEAVTIRFENTPES